MKYIFWMLIAVIVIVLLLLLTAYVCYRIVFYAGKKKVLDPDEIDVPTGELYDPYHEQMVAWAKECRALLQEEIKITSFDGLSLYGKYYEYEPDAPMELMFHGYRGNAERDLCGGVQRCRALGRSALIVDQRTSRKSEGKVISFGINESRDCMSWLEYIVNRWPDKKVILTGISMGASTVMMAAGNELPENVVHVLADCGYSSAKDIIIKCMHDMKLPPEVLYPFVKLGARIFGRFDLEETSPIVAMKKCKVPVVFIHGEADDFVPCEMSKENYEACASFKAILTVPGAGHGLSYVTTPKEYLKLLADFATWCGVKTTVVEK